MKKTSFFQALIIVVLLLLSWGLLARKWGQEAAAPEKPADKVMPGTGVPEPVQPMMEKPTQEAAPASPAALNRAGTPPLWEEWISYLESRKTPAEMQVALENLRDAIFSMPYNTAAARLLELMLSGVEVPTGLNFRVGEGGWLVTAPGLQTLLADWMALLDPERAAAMGKAALQAKGIELGPDLYAVHLRNYARGSTDAPATSRAFIQSTFETLLDNSAWRENPTHSVAEAMDFAVFLDEPELIQQLTSLVDPEAPMLGHAAAMAIERLVQQQPAAAGRELLDTIGQPGMPVTTRASLMARLNPAVPEQRAVIEAYLASPGLSGGELESFFQYLPNLNISLSHNLASPEISITELDDPTERLQSALEALRAWSNDPQLDHLHPLIEETGTRIEVQLSGEPRP